MTERTKQPPVSLGDYGGQVTEAMRRIEREDIVGRIWARDHTVWRDDPREIADRLGWLTVMADMRGRLDDLRAFADSVREAGFEHVVLLGMGGSSLGPEVIGQSIGAAPESPRLIVLDSTVPSRVRSVAGEIDPAKTLFFVSSKSGGTIEPRMLYKYFRRVVELAVGEERAGAHFVAITDPDTALGDLAAAEGFRRAFENPPDIGGRYSVLSLFGLVPAALIGVDVRRLLDSADGIAARSDASLEIGSNPSAWLGALIAATAQAGRDKLTIMTSPTIASFGLWAEQLLAESTGKEGRGVIPVAGEPLRDADVYGDDRVFVYLRLDGDENAAVDVTTERLAAVGHPVVRLELKSPYDLGGEFFRWEFATAVASALLNVHPFDQPDVQGAKDATSEVLDEFRQQGKLPGTEPDGTIGALTEQARPGDYFAIMAYVEQTRGVDAALSELRKQIMERHKIATTMGYGPRFLHSTGQVHKGGPNSGLFLQLTASEEELEIPGEPFGFAALVSAQALGDLRALRAAGRRSARRGLGPDAEGGILRLLASV